MFQRESAFWGEAIRVRSSMRSNIIGHSNFAIAIENLKLFKIIK
jgi:hypothetical protein